MKSRAQPDKLRAAVIGFCNRRKSVSMRELMLYLVAVGLVPAAVKSDDHDDARDTHDAPDVVDFDVFHPGSIINF